MKVDYNYGFPFKLSHEKMYTHWISRIGKHEQKSIGPIAFNFIDDEQLLELNKKYLQHDTLTDIITFDYSEGNIIAGDICISIERVKDNAAEYKVEFKEELHRVMAHGLLHLCGYNDKSEEEKTIMRAKETELMNMFHVEQ